MLDILNYTLSIVTIFRCEDRVILTRKKKLMTFPPAERKVNHLFRKSSPVVMSYPCLLVESSGWCTRTNRRANQIFSSFVSWILRRIIVIDLRQLNTFYLCAFEFEIINPRIRYCIFWFSFLIYCFFFFFNSSIGKYKLSYKFSWNIIYYLQRQRNTKRKRDSS